MAFVVRMKIEGLEDVLKNVAKLKPRMQKVALKAAVGDASKYLVKQVRARVPKDTGQLKRSIGRRVKISRKTGAVLAIVGPRRGFKAETGRNPTRYAHLVELGTSHSAAQPFMRTALEASRETMMALIRRRILLELDKAAAAGKGG